ncbi:hypothetical protein BX666DRAFT_1105588 [Dichotomocladium elegans]|nr:hypothetical protein BX666DRAFT_1105588 [Dichotomocladium elegans]
MHPFIAADKQLARLLVACLLEYSKIQYGDTSASLQYQSKSVSWCIIRIRHMVNVSRHQNRDDSVIEKRIQELITKLNDDISHQRLSADKVCDFLDRSLLLIDAKLGPALITRLITASIKIRGNGPVVSPRFLQRLVGSSTANDVWAIYKSWPDDIKLELWKSHPEILRVELLNHLDLQKENNKPKDLDSLYGSLVKVLGRDRQVCQHAFKIIADALLKFENWRVFRVGWYLVRELLQGMSQVLNR